MGACGLGSGDAVPAAIPRAVQAYLMAIPAVSQVANRDAIRTLGPVNTVVPIFERSVFLTANDNTVYSWTWVDLSKGPVVLVRGICASGRVRSSRLRRFVVRRRNDAMGHVWTARVGKENLHFAALVGAAMCSACLRGTHDRWP